VTRSSALASQPGDLLLAPPILFALVTLVVNDHLLKGVAPAPLTGILSGIAGIVVMPAVLVAGAELAMSVRGRWVGPRIQPMLAACLAVGLAYAAVELLPVGTELYRWTWGVLQWPAAALLALVSGEPRPAVVPVQAVADPFDLLALPFLAGPLAMQALRTSRPSGQS
jgi:hypothetical protein